MDEIIRRALAERDAHLAARSALTAERATLVEGLTARGATASFTEAEQARFDELNTQARALTETIDADEANLTELRGIEADDARLTALAGQRSATDAPAPHARVTSEPQTYSRAAANEHGTSFFRDLIEARLDGNIEATQRLSRHLEESREGYSERAVATSGLASLVPPQYLTEEWAPIARAGRPYANLVRHEQLPAKGMSLVIPRGTANAATAVQATQNTAVQNTDIAVTDLTVPVVTIAGQQVVSRQSLDRGNNVDSIIFNDLALDYATKVDAQCLAGTGASGQMLGVLNTGGITQMSAFGAAATITTFYSKLAGAVVAIQTGRFLSPTGIVVHPRRLGWLIAAVDTAGRPLFVPNASGPNNAIGMLDTPLTDVPSPEPSGWIQGIPVYTDAQIPSSVGTGPEDQVIVQRLEDAILWEDGNGAPTQFKFEQPFGASLGVNLVAAGYAAFTAGRYPLATAIIGGNAGTAGNGLVAPAF